MTALAFFIQPLLHRDANLCSRDGEVLCRQCRVSHQKAVGYHKQFFTDRIQSIAALHNISARHRTGPVTVFGRNVKVGIFKGAGEIHGGIAALKRCE
ncbi:hypothetical protein SDC9_173588 [bioreactor metagenome]|uniref:Uncharacterized protein n=1 Tax=bioreactor metagenome TaxID=1076179 RepID=A0A645GQD0_9ZZZZ